MHQCLILAKVFWKLAILELGQCLRKIEIAPVLLLGSNFPSHMVSWLQLRNHGAGGLKQLSLFAKSLRIFCPNMNASKRVLYLSRKQGGRVS